MENKGPFSRWVFTSNTFVLLEGSRKGDRLKGTKLLISHVLGTGPLEIRVSVTLKPIYQSLWLEEITKAKCLLDWCLQLYSRSFISQLVLELGEKKGVLNV